MSSAASAASSPSVAALAGEHYLRMMPGDKQAWWMWLVFAGSLVVALERVVAVFKARSCTGSIWGPRRGLDGLSVQLA